MPEIPCTQIGCRRGWVTQVFCHIRYHAGGREMDSFNKIIMQQLSFLLVSY